MPVGRRYHAINLFGILFAKGPCSQRTINHEKIHTAQIREMLYIFFYIWYVAEWMVRLIICRSSHEAYRKISFEREAYANESNPAYLSQRRHFASFKYFK